MANLRVTGIQMVVGQAKSKNLPKILEAIKGSDCDFILFPEMSLTGYNNGFSTTRTEEAWKQIAAACRQSYVTAVVGTGVRPNGYVNIQSRIFSDEGSVLGSQEKLVPTESDRVWCRPGDELRDSNLVIDPGSRNASELVRKLHQNPNYFASAFWSDGQVRLSGREYNGLVISPCYTHGSGERKLGSSVGYAEPRASVVGRDGEPFYRGNGARRALSSHRAVGQGRNGRGLPRG